MRIFYLLFIEVLIAGFSIFIVSCASEACFEETNSYLKATFYNNTTKKQVAPDSVTLFGVNHESTKIYNKASNVQPALFPLDPASEKSTFVIRINGVTDTIQFLYSSYPHLISKECGYTFYQTLDTFFFSRNRINYIYRSSNKITTINEENIRIFY
ncbi:MAG: DUF6452 family protein [Bacteroidota bacterium]|nr:DUF6452 family protein [Bacteroidota bacterium]